MSVPLLFVAVRRMWSTPAGAGGGARPGGAADRGDHLAQRHDGRRDDGADRARAVPDRARERERLERLAVGGRGGTRDRLRREAARVAGRAAGPRGARLPGAARAAPAAPGAAVCRRRRVCGRGARRGWERRCWSLPTTAPTRSARPTAARGTPHSCSTAPTDWRASRSNPRRSISPGHHYPVATQSERDHIPIVPPSPTRLFARVGPLSGERLGLELLLALLLGVPALLSAVCGDRRLPSEAVAGDTDSTRRMHRAAAAGLRRLDAHRHRAVQRDGAPAPPLRGGARPGRDRDVRDRRCVGYLRLRTRAADRADGGHGRADLLRRPPAVRTPGKLVDRARRRGRRGRARRTGAHARKTLTRVPRHCSRAGRSR